MATTAAAIRAAMLSLLEDITPSVHSGDRFRAHRELGDFRDWCEAHPTACQRRVSIRNAGNTTSAAVSDTLAEEVSDQFEVVIAYPTNWRHGDAGLLDIDDVIASDLVQVDKTIGPTGYGNFGTIVPSCTVLRDGDYERESLAGVTVGVIRYRVHFYRALAASVDQPVTVTGLGGAHLATGNVVTGEANIRAIVIANGIAKVTHQTPSTPGAETLAHYLSISAAGVWTQVTSAQYGDWSYFAVGATVAYDRATIVEATAEAVEIDFQVDAYSLTGYSGGGVPSYDNAGNLNYPQSSAVYRRHTSTVLVKTIRVERGNPGYFVGWHSSPRIGPANSQIPSLNNTHDFGERELGTGGGNAVTFSSANFVARHPADGADARWAAAIVANGAIANRVMWMGIDDATYSIWATPSVIALQNAGFPAEQATGPFWVADIPSNAAIPFARFMVTRERLEFGAWQFGGTADGVTVLHFANESHSPAGVPYRHQTFIGATPYVANSASAYINEPTARISSEVALIAGALEWPAR